ncbi:hypothetical protein [Encephalitozoon cuniculi GB-M1]|uniref:Telomeric single stranded DNA binding POT1/Cdc13 domain-containing protein n=2 Tax=Encephalitozoon cuniculi TaxID=6035 RepID=Q8SVI8_ENCCU|nr:uncharacterized protein ECU05_1050 [Encephalitozoon cuniculi GB-M1]AGE95387.1 hypothetical protein ECU05_1050 [Encephalitozoon cuniculi]KMV66162.1 hypothetical protein M970_051050 [Encephalitozoon cuniculi EcunIII-L]UYI27899.1 putative protection of telomeres protein 1 [Encephalitozoon cuniculi]CAD26625.1 hypothetical protein [Encephalitozoon cuniculi GB-M1]
MQAEEDERECTKISDMTGDKYYTIYGVVVDWLEWKRCRGRDFMMTLDVTDECMKKLSVKIFSPTKIFSEGFCVGEVVRIGRLRLYDTCKAVVDRSNDVEVVFTPHTSLSSGISPRIQQLVELFRQKRKSLVKEREISEVEEGQYFDFNGELIDKQRERSNLILLRFVDYSINQNVQGQGSSEDYSKDMVLTVKAWGRFATEADKCEIGGWYRVRNLKGDEVGYRLYASLSESSKGSISEIGRNTTLGRYLGMKKNRYLRGLASRERAIEAVDGMVKQSIVEIKSILSPGIYRIRVHIKRYAPFVGMEAVVCKACGSEHKEIDDVCGCSRPEMKRVKALKLLLWDGSSELVAVCRNKLAEHILDRKSNEYLNGKMFDCIILSVREGFGMVHHLVDLGFFRAKKKDCAGKICLYE